MNYSKLIAANPTSYNSKVINQKGQVVEFVEHPTKGDEYPVIAFFPDYKEAYCTDFWDTDDFGKDSDYNPIRLEEGKCDCAYMEWPTREELQAKIVELGKQGKLNTPAHSVTPMPNAMLQEVINRIEIRS